eukprot:1007711-Rhodomonas_salina.1
MQRTPHSTLAAYAHDTLCQYRTSRRQRAPYAMPVRTFAASIALRTLAARSASSAARIHT